MKIKTENANFQRDMNSKALVRSDTKELNEYKFKAKVLRESRTRNQELNNMKDKLQEIDTIKNDLEEIKHLLKGLINK